MVKKARFLSSSSRLPIRLGVCNPTPGSAGFGSPVGPPVLREGSAALLTPGSVPQFPSSGSCSSGGAVGSVPCGTAGASDAGLRVSKTSGVAARADAPEVFAYSRGDRSLALRIASDPSALASAISALDANVHARSSSSARANKSCTWSDLAVAAGFRDPFRLSPELVKAVTAAMRSAGYRSIDSYVCIAKQEHVDRYGDIDMQLALTCTRCIRSCKRGKGPPRKTEGLPLLRLSELEEDAGPWIADGPLFPRRLLVIGGWFMCREIEISTITLSGVSFSFSSDAVSSVTLSLQATKNDFEALGSSRTLACSCAATPQNLCPACIAHAQYRFAFRAATLQGKDIEDFPLFPTKAAVPPSKKAIVETIRHCAVLLGLPTKRDDGSFLHSGHDMRPMGAKVYANAGIEVDVIAGFGRWNSKAVYKYTREATLAASHDLPSRTCRVAHLVPLREVLSLGAPSRQPPRAPVDGEPLVLNIHAKGSAEGRLHACDSSHTLTRCGWSISGLSHVRPVLTFGRGALCDSCFLSEHDDDEGEPSSASDRTDSDV
jgi:hypothetical protein